MSDTRIRYLLIDFDGVVAINSLEITLDFTCDYIKHLIPGMHKSTIINFYRSVNSFDLKASLQLLFSSLGIQDSLSDFSEQISILQEYNGKKIEVYDKYALFVENVGKQGVDCKIFSLASKQKIMNLLNHQPNFMELGYNPISKANRSTYEHIISTIGCRPEEICIIDDDPLVLFIAKTTGLKTIWMKNDFFIHKCFESSFDHSIEKLDDVLDLILVN